MPILVTLLAAYLIGSVPFGFIVARLRGVDIFKQGSGNIGATNVGRVLGRRFGALVFVLDFFKGMVPVLLGHWVAEHWPSAPLDEFPAGSLETAAGLAAFLGHLFPIYLRFRGGKGVATGTGVVAVLAPLPMVVAAVAWGLVVLAFRYVSLASIGAALVLVLAQLRLHAAAPSGFVADPRSWFCVLAAVMVVVRHRTNIRRLVEGRENRLKETRFMAAATRIVHLFALCLWFGGTVFFSFIAAPSLFARFEEAPNLPANARPWFPSSPLFAKQDEAIKGPREQGTLAAGYAVGGIFPTLFLLQAACGFAAVATALPWMRAQSHRRLHGWRVSVLLAALSCVLAGWPLQTHVRELQGERHNKTFAYLTASDDLDQKRTEMQEARKTFGLWHLASLLLSFVMILLVGLALALAAWMPSDPAPTAATPEPASTVAAADFPTESLEH